MEVVKTINYPENKKMDIHLNESTEIKVMQNPVYAVCKRIFDVVMSLFALIVLSPVFLITAVAIYLEDKGDIFFTQERIGYQEKKFNMYKFRSMKINADKIHEQMKQEYGEEEVSFKIKNDPRITKVGKFIRKFNIDELPQLINILKGDMSIVGPRPLPVYEYEEERKRYGNQYIERYAVPQGLTCIWQISSRADVSFERRMQMDVEYAQRCGIRLDLLLIFKTALEVITGKAEY